MPQWIKIQRGVERFSTSSSVITPSTTFGSTASTFVLNNNNRYMGGGDYTLDANIEANGMSGSIRLTSTTQITAAKELATGNQDVAWEAWEYTGASGGVNEFIVRGRYILDLSTVESITQAVSNISNINDCIPFITGIHSSSTADDADSATAMAWMSSTGTLNVKRGSATNNSVTVYVVVVEFTGSNWTTLHGLAQNNADVGTITLKDTADGTTGTTTSVTDWANAIIFHQYKANNLNGTDDSISDTSAIYYPDTNSTVSFEFDVDHVDSVASGANSGNHFVHVLQNSVLTVTRYGYAEGTGSVSYDLDVTSAGLTDLSTSASIVSRNTGGTGTAYGRGWLNTQLTSITNNNLWVHRDGNDVDTRIQILDFYEEVVKIASYPTQVDSGDTGQIITGEGFEATQGTGKIELASTATYATATKVSQTVTSWSATSLTFTVVSTGLTNNSVVYLFVTNDSGDISKPKKVTLGELAYDVYVKSLSPDIYHRFNNSYTDEQGVADANSQTTLGTFGFETTPISRNNSYSWRVEDNNSRIEMNDTIYTNSQANKKRNVGGWIQLDRVHLVPSGFYEEGGGVNNLYMVIGFGNRLLGNIADSNGNPDYKIQGFSDITLSTDRPYHVMVAFECSSSTGADDGRFHMYVDGVEVSKYAGLETIPNQIIDTTFSSHVGDWSYGKPDANLDTGGTDIAYPGGPFILIADFATWSDLGNAPLSDQEVRNLFLFGVIPTNTLSSNTNTNMQTALDAIAPIDYTDEPCPLKIYKPTDNAGDLNLDFEDITFDDRCSIQVLWMGGGTLTITNYGTSNTDISKCESINDGTITIINPDKLTIVGIVDGSQVNILDASNNSELDEVLSSSGDYTLDLYVSSIHVIIIHDGYNVVQKFNINITSDTIIPITQEKDYTYDNPV